MITQDEAIQMAREVGAERGANVRGTDVSLNCYWCSEPDSCECGDEACTKPTKGVYMSNDALTALCNAVWKQTLLDAADEFQKVSRYGFADTIDFLRRMAGVSDA